MSTDPTEVNEVLKQWIELFMTRSHHHLVRYLRSADLSMAQFGTLMRLHHDEHCGVGDIANQMSISNAAASQLVDKLVQQRLVARIEDPHDRRAKRLSITPAGQRLLDLSREARLAWTGDVVAQLTPARRASVTEALQYLIEASEAVEGPEAAKIKEIKDIR
jgi:DNA-binding MarR family transcriptional regulator